MEYVSLLLLFSSKLLIFVCLFRILSHSISNGFYCGDINRQVALVGAPISDSIVHSQWYPFDTGLFSRIIEKRKWQLVDTESFDEVLDVRGDFVHFDWNPVDVNHVALVQGNLVKFVDLRIGSALSSLIPKSRHFCNLSRVVWHPQMDGKGIFIGNSDGRIFYYDTRILTREMSKTPTQDRNYRAPIMSMQISPEMSQLITVSNDIIQWDLKLKHNSESVIRNSNIHFQTKFAPSDRTFWLCNLMQPFITSRWIYVGNRNQVNWTNDIIAYDRKTGRIGRTLSSNIQYLSNLEDYTNVIAGVRRTKYEDDPNPQLIYIKNNCGLIRCKLLDIDASQPLPVSNSTVSTTEAQPETSSGNAAQAAMDDRWSDDET